MTRANMDGSPAELLQMIHLGDGAMPDLRRLVFRGEQIISPEPAQLADEIAAMANTAGGMLVLGVDGETKDVIGIPRDRLDVAERLVSGICNDSIRGPVHYRLYKMELPDSLGEARCVIRVEVPRSLFVHESPGGYFRRQGSSKRKMPPDMLARLFQQRSQARVIRFEEQAVPGTKRASLDDSLWQRFLAELPDDPVKQLHKRGLLTNDDSGVERGTVAGVLMCCRKPEEWLPGAFIQAVRYRGVRQDSNYQIDAQEINGPLDEQVRVALSFVRRNMTVAARKAPARLELPQFSMRAVFEAVVNAVAHRDYSVYGSKIRLFMFDDRLDLYSPGPLPNTVTIDSIALRQSTRNELITTLLARCPVDDQRGELGRRFLMEKRGDGVPIILEESRKLAGRLPEYRLIDDAELLLTIWAADPKMLDGDGEEDAAQDAGRE